MLATPENMKLCEANGYNAVTYSHDTGERYSATSGDYWDCKQDSPLVDSNGNAMELVRKVAYYEAIA